MVDPYPAWMSTVFIHREADRSSWRVLAGWTEDGHLMTSVFFERDDRVKPVGDFGGPPVWDGDLINFWYGYADDTPTFVVVRARPEVRRIEMTVGAAPSVELALSEVLPDFGVKFAAHRLSTTVNILDVKPQFQVTA